MQPAALAAGAGAGGAAGVAGTGGIADEVAEAAGAGEIAIGVLLTFHRAATRDARESAGENGAAGRKHEGRD